jgi:hypothetical protein
MRMRTINTRRALMALWSGGRRVMVATLPAWSQRNCLAKNRVSFHRWSPESFGYHHQFEMSCWSFWNTNGVTVTDFLHNAPRKNHNLNHNLNDNLKPVIMENRWGFFSKVVCFQSADASLATSLTFEEPSKSPLQPPHSWGFHASGPSKTALGEIHFCTEKEVQYAVQNWLIDKQEYVHDGVMELVKRWRSIEKQDKHVDNYCNLFRSTLRNKMFFFLIWITIMRPPLWSSGQRSWLQIQRSGFDSRGYQIFWEVVGLERGPLSLVKISEELFQGNNGSGLENRD